MKIYKIKNNSTGLFSTGGTSPRWTKKGKTWNQMNHVTAHLNLITPSVYHNCDLLEYTVSEVTIFPSTTISLPVISTPIELILLDIKLKKEEKKRKCQVRQEEYVKEKELKELERLKEKYEKH